MSVDSCIATLQTVVNKSFDYIIVGGGTAGLCLAARLTEDPTVSVLVLEAGEANINDPAILTPGHFGSRFGQPAYDWGFKTVPQKHANNTQFSWSRGKGLGGTSGINFMCWLKPPREDIDDWEKLNPGSGWNWKNYQQYSKRTEKFIPIGTEEQAAYGLKLDKWTSGTNGPLVTTHPKTILDVEIKAQQTLINMGVPSAPAPLAGNPSGTFFVPNTLDPSTLTRTYSTTAFYLPNAHRTNLTVLVSANVRRIATREVESELVATGVEFNHGGQDEVHVAHAKQDVVLCAGALKSPQILELSGIGRKDVLGAIGVPLKLELQGVGENVQEHMYAAATFQLKDGVPDETYDILRDPAVAAEQLDLYAQHKGIFTMGITSFSFQPLQAFSPRADEIHQAAKVRYSQSVYTPGLAEQYQIQLEKLERGAPGCEIITIPGLFSVPNPPLPGKKYFSILAATNHNFSRGTIHSVSDDPTCDPAFDPHYFEEDIDLDSMIEIMKFIRTIPQNAPFKDYVDASVVELNPGPEVETDDQLGAWLKAYSSTTFHTASSLSMLPRDKGGVVDPQLKVYGTKNLRVVDLSIVPLHFAAHSQATVYAIAEQAADIIKGKF